MDIGMLWFDEDQKANLSARIQRAVKYYQDKYGRVPNICFIHPMTAGDEAPERVEALEVRMSRKVLPGHFWLGVGVEQIPMSGEACVQA